MRWRDIGTDALYVKQSVWRGKTQTTKSKAANRPIALSPHLAAHLSLRREADSNLLIFRTKKETPWDHNLGKRLLKDILTGL